MLPSLLVNMRPVQARAGVLAVKRHARANDAVRSLEVFIGMFESLEKGAESA
jgi:hypothetical protein